ncbi:hypothetical protein GF380_03075, partial [Candidatus Uhrbacteria bacterium]|nr:hypothetical protein [Candidatus Uhrbacteria bacterium]MBD3284127.1 hypothetical protein [Candidatus Uhrbacteria bacterium]
MSESMYLRLMEYGLSDKEARVYLSLIQRGSSTAQEIATHSTVHRSTIYAAIDALKGHGLVSCLEDEKRTLFYAENPKRLAELIDEEVRMARTKQESVTSLIPELLALHRSDRSKPVVRFFEGMEGLRSFRSLLRETKTKQYDTFARLHAKLTDVACVDEIERHQIARPLVRYRM